jgi:PAS domain S-box-containing protein
MNMKTLAPAATLDQVTELSALYQLTDKLYRARSIDAVYEAALDAIMTTLKCTRASILLFDAAGVMQFVAWRGLSDQYRFALRGHSPWKAGESEPKPIFVPNIDDTNEADWVKDTIKADGIVALGFIPLVSQGVVIGKFMTYYATPHAFEEHEIELAVTIARQVGFSVERFAADLARRTAEQELRESEERFRLMLEHAPVMIWMSHSDGSCLHLNQMLRTFWNVEEDAVGEFDWRSTMHPDDADGIVAAMGGALLERRPVSLKGRFSDASGEWRVVQTDARPRFSASGEFQGMIGVNVDVSDRERADAQRELLLAELNHRVKNSLAVVQAIAHQTLRNSDLDRARVAFEGRLAALAAAHNLLTQANWESAPLMQIVREAVPAHGPSAERLFVAGAPVLLPPKQALAIAMALHELFTNAVKYGAFSDERGRINLEWRVSEKPERRLAITWRERQGPVVVPPRHKGFGSMLLERTLALDLDGEVATEFQREGLVCTIEAPLPDTQRCP